MKKILFFIQLLLVLFFVSTVKAADPIPNATYCRFYPDGQAGAVTGNVTISSNCAIYGDIDGVANGNLTVLPGARITLHKNLVFSQGNSINIQNGGIIYINTGGKMVQGGICIKDADGDGYAETTTLDKDPYGNPYANPITQIDQKITTSGSCTAFPGYRPRAEMNNLTIIDTDSSTTPDQTKLATSDRELLRLGFNLNGITDAEAAVGDIQIIDKNLLVCTGGACPATNFTTTEGSLYVAGKVGIGETAPSSKLAVKGNENTSRISQDTGANYLEIAQDDWSASFGLLFNAYKDPVGVNGNLYTTGNTIYKRNPDASNRATAAIGGYLNDVNGGHIQLYSAVPGTANTAITWTQIADFSKTSTWLSPRGTNSDFYVKSDGNVGIGITSPTEKMEVVGGIMSNYNNGAHTFKLEALTDRLRLRIGGSTAAGRNFAIEGAGDARYLTILGDDTSNGNVGIGMTNPGSKLVVSGQSSIYMTNPTSVDTATQLLIGEQTNNQAYKLSLGYFTDGVWKSSIQSKSNSTGAPLILNGVGGNVGIGKTNPGTTLQVAGIRSNTISRATSDVAFGGGDMFTYFGALNGTPHWGTWMQAMSDADGYFPIVINPLGGYVGIGTSNPTTQLEINGSQKMNGHLYINNTSPTVYFQDTDHRSAMLHNNSNLFYILRGSAVNSTSWTSYNGVWPFTVNLENNNITTGGSVTATSDIRLKTNIKPLPENIMDKVKQLEGVYYNWKTEADMGNARQIGVTAQEVEKIFPELVIDNADGYKSVAYDRFTPILIEAVKEQQVEIDSLKQQVTDLNQRLIQLENKLK